MGKKLLYGVGINDADYAVFSRVDGKQEACPIYTTWYSMIKRCYSKLVQEKQPTYSGCSVCLEWMHFMVFHKWMVEQDWEGKCLDKDILIQGNKIYSQEACIFTSGALNRILLDSSSTRGIYPVGVSWHKGTNRFKSRVSNKNESVYMGLFPTELLAHQAWQKAKKKIIHDVAMEQTDVRIKNALLLRCQQLQDDLDNNRITIKL